ncbi:MAG: vWA domain-containing protein, partial [Acidobacteriota bacterium]
MTQTKPTLELIPLKTKLEAGCTNTMDVLVKIKSPEIETSGVDRPALNLSLVLDRSGSMGGTKMRDAIEAAKTCIDNLLPSDTISCVVFDEHIEVLFPSQRATEKQRLKSLFEVIYPRGSTALQAAWVKGGLEVTNSFVESAVNRVLLVTDGQANVGECNPSTICEQVRGLRARGVSTSTIGIGGDFNEDLLIPMADAGAGNSWHVRTSEDLTKIFDVELSGLVGQFGHSATLGIRAAAGIEILDVLNDFEKTADGRHRLPNLTAANDLDIIVRLCFSERPEGRLEDAVRVDISFVGQTSGIAERVDASLALDFVAAEEAAKSPASPATAEAAVLLDNARDRRRAIERLDLGDFAGASYSINSLASRTRDLHGIHPSLSLMSELEGVQDEIAAMERREMDMARKMMSYS